MLLKSQDMVWELHAKEHIPWVTSPSDEVFRWRPVQVHSTLRPTREDNEKVSPMMKFEGLWVLNSLPRHPLPLQQFEKNWKSDVRITYGEIRSKWDTADFQKDVEAWTDWVNNIAPQSDDVNEYILGWEAKNGKKFTTPLEGLFNLPFNQSIISEIQQTFGASAASGPLVMDTQPSVIFRPKGFGPFNRDNVQSRRFRDNAALKGKELVGKITDDAVFGEYESLTAAALHQLLKQRGLSLSKVGGKAAYVQRLKEADATEVIGDTERNAELAPSEIHEPEGVVTSFEYGSDSETEEEEPRQKQRKKAVRRKVSPTKGAAATTGAGAPGQGTATVGKSAGSTRIRRGRKPIDRSAESAHQSPTKGAAATTGAGTSGQGTATGSGAPGQGTTTVGKSAGSAPVVPGKKKLGKKGSKKPATCKLLQLSEDPSYPAPVNISSVLFTSRKC